MTKIWFQEPETERQSEIESKLILATFFNDAGGKLFPWATLVVWTGKICYMGNCVASPLLNW